jgi:hypothetical protein
MLAEGGVIERDFRQRDEEKLSYASGVVPELVRSGHAIIGHDGYRSPRQAGAGLLPVARARAGFFWRRRTGVAINACLLGWAL